MWIFTRQSSKLTSNKSVKKISKFYAHDPNEDAQIGDMVSIEETRPLSKLKS
ncbi:MAG: uS17 family ribosomal protein, partial [Sweet potato little leaf phytoplasma]|nr:uS17 family ribosomal protein [Sweet potato little leaf phytoplasma]